jgi:type I restriction enzyme S subunit
MDPIRTIKLPKGWISLKFENLMAPNKCSIKRGPFGSTVKKAYFVKSGFKVYEQKNAIYDNHKLGNYYINEEKFNELSDFAVKPGDFLVSCSGTIGKITQLPDEAERGIINQALLKLSLDKSLILSKYFLYYFRSHIFQKRILKETRGSAIKNITSVKDIKSILISLPPLNEQNLIVEKIEELFSKLDAGTAALERIRVKIKNYRQAVLKHAFAGKLTEKWREKNKNQLVTALNLLKNSNKITNLEVYNYSLYDLPNKWFWAKIDDVSEVVRGASPRPAGHPKYFGGKIPWITVREITKDSNVFLYSVSNFLTTEGKKKSRYIESGTFLLTNSGATLGVPKISSIGGCINDGSVAIIGLNNTLKLYLYYFLLGQTKNLRRINQGAAQPNLNTGIVRKIVFPLPPVKEQEKIVEEIERRFENADRVEQVVKKCLKKAEAVRQSILKKAFSGKLVPQNPADESAEKLLKKIQQR